MNTTKPEGWDLSAICLEYVKHLQSKVEEITGEGKYFTCVHLHAASEEPFACTLPEGGRVAAMTGTQLLEKVQQAMEERGTGARIAKLKAELAELEMEVAL